MIPPEELQAVLDLLEPYAGHPATGALHDPVYLLLQDPHDEAQIEALRQAVVAHPEHPAVPLIRSRLGSALDFPSPSLEEVLQADAPMASEVDPVAEVQVRLARAQQVRKVLEERIAELEAQRAGAARLANVMAMVASFLAVAAILGWLAALGAWKLSWFEPPRATEDAGQQAP